MKTNTDDVATLTYEDARDELIAIVAKLETGSATLDESLGLWERGEALAVRCQDLLNGARDRITQSRDEVPAGATDDDGARIDLAADAGVVGVVPDHDSPDNEGGNDAR